MYDTYLSVGDGVGKETQEHLAGLLRPATLVGGGALVLGLRRAAHTPIEPAEEHTTLVGDDVLEVLLGVLQWGKKERGWGAGGGKEEGNLPRVDSLVDLCDDIDKLMIYIYIFVTMRWGILCSSVARKRLEVYSRVSLRTTADLPAIMAAVSRVFLK